MTNDDARNMKLIGHDTLTGYGQQGLLMEPLLPISVCPLPPTQIHCLQALLQTWAKAFEVFFDGIDFRTQIATGLLDQWQDVLNGSHTHGISIINILPTFTNLF